VEHDSEFEYNNYDVVEKLIVNDSTHYGAGGS
jgi:hypothetical protein